MLWPGQDQGQGPQDPSRRASDAQVVRARQARRARVPATARSAAIAASPTASSAASTTACATRSAAPPHELVNHLRDAAPGAPLLQQRAPRAARAISRSRRTSTTRTRICAHMVLSAQAVRLHAQHAVRRRAVGRQSPLQGHDLHPDRDLGRGRDQRPQPRADGARRGEGQVPRRSSARRSPPEPAYTLDELQRLRGRRTAELSADAQFTCRTRPKVVGSAANFALHVTEAHAGAECGRSARGPRRAGRHEWLRLAQ